MAVTEIELCVSAEVSGQSTDETQTHVPGNGNVLEVECFHGDASFSQNAVIVLEWDGSPIWTIKGSSKMPFTTTVVGDGVKVMKLILDNGLTGPVYMSGYARLREHS